MEFPKRVITAQTQAAWSQGRTFLNMVRGCLLRKMSNMGLDKDLAKWTDSFMEIEGPS